MRPRICQLCQRSSPYISSAIGICDDCLLERPVDARPRVDSLHAASRVEFDVPTRPPPHPSGIRCVLRNNECIIGENERGFCGLRTTRSGRLVHLAGTPARGHLRWYRDPLPTNCVADWVCEGSKHRGNHNLTVLYASGAANCLFRQNWHFRDGLPTNSNTMSCHGRKPDPSWV